MQEENLSDWLKLDDMNFYCSVPFYGVNIMKVNSIAYMDKKAPVWKYRLSFCFEK